MGDMSHQLQWMPGNHGKGLIAPNGDVHTWNLDAEDGPPHHGDYIEGVNEQTPRTFVLRNGYKGYDLFGIRPDGLYSGSLGLEKLDPRLVPTDKWNFQPATDGPVQVVNVDHWHTKEDPHPPKYLEGKLDKPFVYDPEGRTVYMGQPGGYHTDLWTMIPGTNPIERSGWPMGRLRETHIEDNPYTGEVDHIPQEAEWFSRPPENHEEVHQAIGAPPLSGKWAWIFNSATQHQLGWQPGQWGKGLVHDGNVHTWNTGVYDGQPTHPQYAEQKLGLSPEEWLSDNKNNGFSTAFQVHPDGKVRFWDPVDNDLRDLVQSAHPHFDTYASPYDSAWNFQSRVAMPVGEDYWNGWQEKGGHELYHGTSSGNLESIMQQGLHPWDSPVAGGSMYDAQQGEKSNDKLKWLMPRPEHVYLGQEIGRASCRERP